MNIEKLFESLSKDGFQATNRKYWDAVSGQGRVHNRRIDASQLDLIRRARPDEDDKILAYRIANFRQITYPSVSKHKTKVKRVLNFTVDLSDVLINEGFNPDEFAARILDDIYENPNVVYFVLPFIENDQLRPPALLNADQRPSISLLRLDSKNLIYYDNDFVCFKYLDIKVDKMQQATYILADKNNIYFAYPEKVDKNYVYKLDIWYKKIVGKVDFNIGKSFAVLPGVISKTHDDKLYQETFFKGAYEFFDEVLTSFSDSQAVSWRYNYPKPVMAEIDCPASGCEDGKITETDTLGNFLRNEKGIPVKRVCKMCNGAGKISDPTVFKTLTYPKGDILQPSSGSRPILEYITPDVGIIASSFQRPFDLLKLGEKAIGLDLLENAGGNSSDLSLERRMEDLLDMIAAIGKGLYDAIDTIMYNIELIRSPFIADVSYTKVQRPSTFSIMTTSDYKEIADNAYQEDRITSKLNMYRQKYKNDTRLLDIYYLILYCDPMATMTVDEIENNLALALLTRYDSIRHMYIFQAVESAYDKDNFITVAKCQGEILKYLVDNGLWVAPIEVPAVVGAPI